MIQDKVLLLTHRYNELVHGGLLYFYVGSLQHDIIFTITCLTLKNLCRKGFLTEAEILEFRYPITFMNYEQ